MSATKGSPSHAEQVLAAAGRRLRAQQPAFDVIAGLHRLARDAGYIPVTDTVPSVSRALRDLEEFVSWSLDQSGAAIHVERLAVAIGEPPYKLLTRDQDTQEVDLDGAHVFACMLYVAGHPESAQFWWRFTAGAGNSASAFCLHLLHHGRGETAEAEHWRDILLNVVDLDDDPDVPDSCRHRGSLARHLSCIPTEDWDCPPFSGTGRRCPVQIRVGRARL
jgi:hypothetical protein